MGKFRVGDIIIGNAKATDKYVVTTEGWLGRVVKTTSGYTINVHSIYEPSDRDYQVNSEYFELYNPFPEDAEI